MSVLDEFNARRWYAEALECWRIAEGDCEIALYYFHQRKPYHTPSDVWGVITEKHIRKLLAHWKFNKPNGAIITDQEKALLGLETD